MPEFVDAYSLRARVAPAVLVLLPVFLAASAWVPQDAGLTALPIGAVVAVGSAALLSQLGRDLGKRKEPSLFTSWGGSPTVALLSFDRSTINPQTLRRIHKALRDRSPAKAMPIEPAEEGQDPEHAAQTYASVTEWLRERTRDRHAFPLVFEENVNYGFRRNLWGMKSLGITSAIAGAGISMARIICALVVERSGIAAPVIFGAVSLAFMILWVVVVRPVWVRGAAVAYAQRLLGVVEVLS